MLISTISFDVHDFKNNISQSFIVENTIENLELIEGHRFTRAISFAKEFDFDFNRKSKMPTFMIEAFTLQLNSYSEEENEIDEIDEMVGTF